MKNLEQSARALFVQRRGDLSATQYLALEELGDEAQRHTAYAEALRCGEATLRESLCRIVDEIESWSREGIETIAFGSVCYPALLAHIHEPPLVLFTRGESELLSTPRAMLAIVGSRRGDSEACELTRTIATQLAARAIIVVSGLAAGIDAAAHRGALQSTEGLTIAILGNGLRHIYPAFHRELNDQILARGGLLVSQFEPAVAPYPSNFLNRNRVIAGLSVGVVVVQAAERSGSLVTARYALEEGREVLVVPGAVSGARYSGSHRLLRDGATLITCAEDIFETLPQIAPLRISKVPATKLAADCSSTGEEQKVFAMLKEGACTNEELRAALPARGQLETILLSLEINGVINREPGGIVRLSTTT